MERTGSLHQSGRCGTNCGAAAVLLVCFTWVKTFQADCQQTAAKALKMIPREAFNRERCGKAITVVDHIVNLSPSHVLGCSDYLAKLRAYRATVISKPQWAATSSSDAAESLVSRLSQNRYQEESMRHAARTLRLVVRLGSQAGSSAAHCCVTCHALC